MKDESRKAASRVARKLLSCFLGVVMVPHITAVTQQAVAARSECEHYGSPVESRPEAPTHHRSNGRIVTVSGNPSGTVSPANTQSVLQ